MDANKQRLIELKINKTIENLKKNNMDAYSIKSRDELFDKLNELINDHQIVSYGGSVTLNETGVKDYLRIRNITLLDRDAPNAVARDIYLKSFLADTYLMSSNAITEEGELFNIDGNGNRVAALIYGPESVIVIAGYNKIVSNIDEALKRVKSIAAPANGIRLNTQTPCEITGFCSDCKSPKRMCCHYVTSTYQREKGRIKVLILNEVLGY